MAVTPDDVEKTKEPAQEKRHTIPFNIVSINALYQTQTKDKQEWLTLNKQHKFYQIGTWLSFLVMILAAFVSVVVLFALQFSESYSLLLFLSLASILLCLGLNIFFHRRDFALEHQLQQWERNFPVTVWCWQNKTDSYKEIPFESNEAEELLHTTSQLENG